MNCNPFTKGHYYLIREASKRVDFLYVFVVEEDKSYFAFKDRLEMAKLNCDDLPNVKVLPSGKYMISSITFAEYFKKDSLQKTNIFPVKDVRIFAKDIAACLNIKKRLVGEEPFDYVTYQYNQAMKETLPKYGIEVIEIPRYRFEGKVVSATTVREFFKENNLDSVKGFLTEKTYKYLKRIGIYYE